MAQEVGESTGADPARTASPGGGKGIFDHLTELLIQGQPHQSPQSRQPAAQPESAAAPPADQLPATRPDDPFAVTGRTFLFPETAEELVVEKEVVVREQVNVARLAEAHVRETENAAEAETVEALPSPPEEAIALPGPPEEEAIAPPPPAPEEAIPLPPPEPQQAIAPPAPPAEEAIPLPPPPELVASAPVEATAPPPTAPPPEEARRLVFGGPEDAAALRAAAARPAAPQPAPAKSRAGWGLGSWAWFIILFCMAALVAFYGGQYLGDLYAGAGT